MGSWSNFQRKLDKVQDKYRVGDYVELESRLRGRIRYIGARRNDKRGDVWIGIETEHRGDGESDGIFKGEEYFEAAELSALLVPPGDIVEIISDLRSSRLERSARPLSSAIQQKWFRRSSSYSDSEYELAKSSSRRRQRRGARDESPRSNHERGSVNYNEFADRCIRKLLELADYNEIAHNGHEISLSDAKKLLSAWRRVDEREISSRDKAVDLVIDRSISRVESKLKKMSDSQLDTLMGRGSRKRPLDDVDDSRRDQTSSRLDRWAKDGKKAHGFDEFQDGLKRLKIQLSGRETRKLFENIDHRDRGYVSWHEFKRLVPNDIPINEINLRDLIGDNRGGSAEADDSNYIHRNEFVRYLKKLRNRVPSREAKRIFDAIDTNQRGKITTRELDRMLPDLERIDPEIERVLDRIHERQAKEKDSANDRLVSRDEFDDFLYKERIDISKNQSDDIFDKIDTKGGGLINLQDFKDACPNDRDFADWIYDLADGRRASWDRLMKRQRSSSLRNREVPDVLKWSEAEVCDWVGSLQFLDRSSQEFLEKEFRKARIDGHTLSTLSDIELKEDFKLQSHERKAVLDGVSALLRQSGSYDPSNWNCSEVEKWLEDKRFSRAVIRAFRDERIDGQRLEEIDERELKDFYIKGRRLREEILDARDELFTSKNSEKDYSRFWNESDVKNWAREQGFDSYPFGAMNGKELLRTTKKELLQRGVDRLDIDVVLDAIKKLSSDSEGSEVDLDEFYSRLTRKKVGFPHLEWDDAKEYFEMIDVNKKGVVNWEDFDENVVRRARSLRDCHKLIPDYARDIRKSAQTGGGVPDPSCWNINKTLDWLEDRGYGKYIPQFEVHRIDGAKLKSMTPSLLEIIDNRMSNRTIGYILADIRDLFRSS